MESRSVYLGIATRLRGHSSGALDRVYLHSPVTIALWHGVAEAEQLLSANLLRGVMTACLYGNPATDVKDGNEAVRKGFRTALKTMPYIRFSDEAGLGETDRLVEEWRQMNAELASGGAEGKGAEDA